MQRDIARYYIIQWHICRCWLLFVACWMLVLLLFGVVDVVIVVCVAVVVGDVVAIYGSKLKVEVGCSLVDDCRVFQVEILRGFDHPPSGIVTTSPSCTFRGAEKHRSRQQRGRAKKRKSKKRRGSKAKKGKQTENTSDKEKARQKSQEERPNNADITAAILLLVTPTIFPVLLPIHCSSLDSGFECPKQPATGRKGQSCEAVNAWPTPNCCS